MSVLFTARNEADLSEWTSETDTGSDLGWANDATAQALAQTVGAIKVDMVGDTTVKYLTKTVTTDTSGKLRIRFYIDPNGTTFSNNTAHYLLLSTSTVGYILGIQFKYLNTPGYVMRFGIYSDDSSSSYVDSGQLTDAPHYVEIYLIRATNSTSADGSVELWIDGASQGSVTAKDNYDRFVNFTELYFGAQSGVDATTSGTYYLDEFIANNDGNLIGPVTRTVDVHDDVTLTANINEGDIAVQEAEGGETLEVNLHDDVTVTEGKTAFIVNYVPNVHEDITVTESQSFLSPTPKLVSPHEDVTVTDSLPGYHKDTIFLFESVVLSTFPTLTVNVHEDVTVSEAEPIIDIQDPSGLSANIHDHVTITETVTGFLVNYVPDVHDHVTVSDTLPGYHRDTIFVSDVPIVTAPYIPLYINVHDDITLDETVDAAIDESFFLSVSDRIRVVEPPFYVLETYVIEVHEDITLTESIVSFQVPVSDYYVEVNENISISESVTPSLLLAGVTAHDHITITENIIASSYPDLSVSIEPENIYVIGVRIYP